MFDIYVRVNWSLFLKRKQELTSFKSILTIKMKEPTKKKERKVVGEKVRVQ